MGLVFDRHAGALPAMLMPIRIGLGGPLGSGRQIMSWIHLQDVVGVMAWLCRRQHSAPEIATYNLVAPENPSQREFIDVAASLLGRPALFKTPLAPIRLLLGEQSCLLLDGQRVTPARLLTEGYAFRYPTLALALRQICFKRPS
jgi:hypothetical protein